MEKNGGINPVNCMEKISIQSLNGSKNYKTIAIAQDSTIFEKDDSQI